MRKNLVVGILREDERRNEFRAPLSPRDVHWLKLRGIKVEVQSSRKRIFSNLQYKQAGAKIVENFKKANLLVGIKEPKIEQLLKKKIYMVFSHTSKGQSYNMSLLKEFLKKKITLIDYEKIVDFNGQRLVYFGRFAGICGIVDSLYYFGEKLSYRNIDSPFSLIKPSNFYHSYNAVKLDMERLNYRIHHRGFDKKISPFIIGITGHGNVSSGVQEILDLLHPIEIHPRDLEKFISSRDYSHKKIYRVIFDREEKLRSKNGHNFYFEEYLKFPRKFESNLDIYLSYLNILIHASYWDNSFPRLVTKKMIDRMYNNKFRLEFIGDLSCDINGSIEMTYRATTPENPTFTYLPRNRKFVEGHKTNGITIMARDNLPTEMPKDSSDDFSRLIREYVYQIAAHGAKDITNHSAISREIRQAVIAQDGRIAKPYNYLKKYIKKDK